MTQALYTIKCRDKRWMMVVNSREFGHFATEQDAVKMAIETAREAGRFNVEGAKVVVHRSDTSAQTVWSSGPDGGP